VRKLEAAMIFFSKVETAFNVPSRGCVVVPVVHTNPDLRVKAGDAVQLRGPNGCLDTRISSVEWLTRHDGGCHLGFLLSTKIDCSEFGANTEIWIDESEQYGSS